MVCRAGRRAFGPRSGCPRARPQRGGVAVDPGCVGDPVAELGDVLLRGLQLRGQPVEGAVGVPGVDVKLLRGVAHGDDGGGAEDRQGGPAQEQRHRVPPGMTQQERLGADLGVLDAERGRCLLSVRARVAGQHPVHPLHDPLDHGGVRLLVARPLARGELPVGDELLGRLRRRAALDTAQHHHAGDDGLEPGAVALDEPVDVVGGVGRRQLGAPAGQELVEDFGGRHDISPSWSFGCRSAGVHGRSPWSSTRVRPRRSTPS